MKRRIPVICSEERCASPTIKRTKVQAQRKFAQGSNNFPYPSTKITLKAPETNGFTSFPTPQPATSSDNDECELNNFSSLPSVDDFLTFLCFRETDVLPERLNYLNTPQFEQPLPKKKCVKTVNPLPVQTLVNEKKNDRSSKMKASKPHLNKIPEYKLRSRNVKSKNIVPKSCRSLALKHNQRLRSKSVVKAKCVESKLQSLKNKPSTTSRVLPTISSHPVKIKSKLLKNRPLTRALERKEITSPISNHSEFKRITRRNSVFDKPSESSSKNDILLKPVSKNAIDVKKTNTENARSRVKKSIAKCLRISLPKTDVTTMHKSSSSKPVTRSAHCGEVPSTTSASSRPSRRTKEAATLYMVMLGKDLLCPKENLEDDDNISIRSFPELPNTEEHIRREKEIKELNQRKNADKMPTRKTGSPKTKPPIKSQDYDSPKPNPVIIRKESKKSAQNTEEIFSSIQKLKFAQSSSILNKKTEIMKAIVDSSQNKEKNIEFVNEKKKSFAEFSQNVKNTTKFLLKSRSNPVVLKKIDKKKKSLISSSRDSEKCTKSLLDIKSARSNPVIVKKIEAKKPIVDSSQNTEFNSKSIQKMKPVVSTMVVESKDREVVSSQGSEEVFLSERIDVNSETPALGRDEITEKPEPEPSFLAVSDDSVTSNEDNEKTVHRCDSTRPSKQEAMARIKGTEFKIPPVHPKTFFANLKGTKEEKPVIQTVVSSNNKGYNWESKKVIFKKNTTPIFAEEREDVSSRKSEAFSPDNENSVYAFEPDLPTTSPPFRRLKPVTPPKSVISNSIAVQVNFEDAKVECSSSGDTQVSSTTDCGDHVFYIPIQTSDTTSTLGVAVKLDTDGPNQKIIMSAKLITSTQTLTTSTSTSTTKSTSIETSCTQTDGVMLSSTEKILKPMTPSILTTVNTDKIVTSTDMQTIQISCSSTSSSDKIDKPVPVKTASQSVKIVKLNKNKKSKIAKLELSKPKSKPVKNKSDKKPTPDTEVHPEKITPKSVGEILEAPTFYPTEDEFNDPLEYIDTIRSVAERYGLCRIVPPSNFRPECKVADEMRFTAYNQYVHKMLHRWGPNVKEMMAIKKYLRTQKITLTQAPLIGGMEVDLPRLYQIVQQCGGLNAVIEKERWHQVADIMKIPKLAQDRITKLDDIYCKYLVPYDVLSHGEREKLLEAIEKEWAAHLENPTDDEVFDDIDECIVKGRTMPLSCFYRIARNTTMMCFGNVEGQEGPSTEKIEEEFWNHVSNRKSHICVHSGSIDSSTYGYGFSVDKKSTFRKHPWNLKVFTNNAASILRSLGPVMGVTVPTLHVGMLYSACCWYRDPHGLPWIEYLHAGANKIWYGIPDEHSEHFKEALSILVPRYCKDKKIWLPSDTVMIPPSLLTAQNVSLSRVVQHPGQFVVVFPKAFTSSIATGYLVSESVYFAHASWLNSAKQIFKDMQDSSEPSGFSLEQLIIFIAEDARSSHVILNKVLPLLVDLRDTEVALRNQLKKLGLSTFEKLNVSKKRKSKTAFIDDEVYECDRCRKNLFVSLVVNFDEQSSYCPRHAATMLYKKPSLAKNFKLLYAYTDDELENLLEKVKAKVEAKGSKKVPTK